MTEDNVKMDIATASDEVTDAPLGSADTTIGHDDDTGPILHKILEALAGDEGSKGEAESLRKWIDDSKCPKQDLEMRDDDGRTLLHVAAADGLLEAARKLIDAKADLNAQDEDGETPLCAACHNGHEYIVELLLGARADTTIANQRQRTPLYVAANLGFESIVQLLCKNPGKDLDIQEKWLEWTPLHTAVYDGKKTIVRYLKDAGARLDLQDEDGWTPIMTAVVKEGEDVLKILLEGLEDGDKSLEIEDSEGRTPLLRAAQQCFWEGARLLVMAGAKCDKLKSTDTDSTSVVTPSQDSALHLAVSADQLELVRLLLDKGANVNALNERGQHSSHLASSTGNEKILELLLDFKNSSGLDARDYDGMTPLHIASSADEFDDDESDHDESNSDEPDHDEPNVNEQEASQTIVNAPTSDNIITSEAGRYIQVIQLLPERDADTTAVTNDDRTALELAFDLRHQEREEAILNALEENTARFSHALRWAASDTKRHTMAVSLLKRQAKQLGIPFPSNSESWPAILWAADAEDPDALWLLIASSPRSKETKNAIKCAKDLVEHRDQSAKAITKSKNQKRDGPDDTKKRDKASFKEDLIRDILNNPPIGLICNDSQEYSSPSLEEKTFSEKFKAAVVQFREQQGFGSIIKSQSVKKTIYTEGPKKIMDSAVGKLEEQAKQLAEWKAKQGGPAPTSVDSNKPNFKQGSPAPIFIDSNKPPKFTWIHLPATNMAWMDGLLQRIMKDEDKSASEFNQIKSFFKDSWIQVPDKVSSSRIMRPRCVWRDAKENEIISEDTNEKGFVEQKSKDNQNKVETESTSLAATAIYMPYFSYSLECHVEQHNATEPENARKVPSGHDKPGMGLTEVEEPRIEGPTTATESADKVDHKKDSDFADYLIRKRDQYQALLGAYQGKIHGSSTLDEPYYHFGLDSGSQQDKTRRNRSQVVTGSWCHKWGKEKKLGSYWPLIRVNQLWIWTIDDKWLISASSHPIDDHENELLDGILDLLEKQREAGGSGLQPSSASELSQFLVDYCVEFYERKPSGINEDRPTDCKLEELMSIRQTFSQSINSIARDETDLSAKFGKIMADLRTSSPKELRARSSPKEQNHDARGPSLDDQLTQATIQAEELSGRVKDILDELNILEATVNYQQDVQRSMKAMKIIKAMKKQEPQSTMKEMKKDKVPETDLSATYIINDINRLDTVAKRVHDAVNTTLSLQQSEVANLQARLSLDQAEASARQGRVLMVFTVVTILFLPLSFLTSFFALDVSSFQAPAWAIGVIFAVSVVFSIPIVMIAFTVKQSIRFMSQRLGPLYKRLQEPAVRRMPMFIHYIRGLVMTLNQKRVDTGDSNPDPDSDLFHQGANQSRTHLTGPHQTENREQSISKGMELDLEKGHALNGGSA